MPLKMTKREVGQVWRALDVLRRKDGVFRTGVHVQTFAIAEAMARAKLFHPALGHIVRVFVNAERARKPPPAPACPTPKKLTPPDLKRCQAERSNGVNFMTLGGRREMIRCMAAPVVIVKELQPGADGQHGSMSLCGECWRVAIQQLGWHTFSAEPIQGYEKGSD